MGTTYVRAGGQPAEEPALSEVEGPRGAVSTAVQSNSGSLPARGGGLPLELHNPAAGDSDDCYIDCDRSTRRRGNARSLWDAGGNSPTLGVVTLDWSRCGFCWDMANGAVK